MEKRRFKQNKWAIAGLLVVIVLIGIAFVLFVDWRAVAQVLQTADLHYLLLASLALVAGLFVYALRWRLLLANKPTWSFTFHVANVGHAGNILIPARAGEPARIIMMQRGSPVSITEATSSFVVERLFEQIMRLVTLSGAILYGVGLRASPATVAGGIGFLVMAFGVIAWLIYRREMVLAKGPRLLAWLPRVTEEGARGWLHDLLANLANVSAPRRFLLVLLWSFLLWFCLWAFFHLTLLALGNDFLPEERTAVSLGALALVPPSAPTQPGLFHASMVAPLAAAGFGAERLTAYAILLHIIQMIWMIAFALWGIGRTGFSPRTLLGKVED